MKLMAARCFFGALTLTGQVCVAETTTSLRIAGRPSEGHGRSIQRVSRQSTWSPSEVPPDEIEEQAEKKAQALPVGRWYGWQTLAMYAAAISLFALGVSDEYPAEALLWGSLMVYTLGGPIIHLAHRESGNGLRSLGLRLGLPVGGLAVGYLVGGVSACDSDIVSCGGAGAIFGSLVGIVTAMAIDSALARESRPSRRWSITPVLLASPQQMNIGVQAWF